MVLRKIETLPYEWSTDNQSIIAEEKGLYIVVKGVVLVLNCHLLLFLLLFDYFLLYFCCYYFILFGRVSRLRSHHSYPWIFLQILRFYAVFNNSQRWGCHFLLDKLIFEKLKNILIQKFPLPKRFKDILFMIPHILLIKILSNSPVAKSTALTQMACFINVIKLAGIYLGIVWISALLFGASSR